MSPRKEFVKEFVGQLKKRKAKQVVQVILILILIFPPQVVKKKI